MQIYYIIVISSSIGVDTECYPIIVSISWQCAINVYVWVEKAGFFSSGYISKRDTAIVYGRSIFRFS